MGQTLTHGIYLPDEGERNCYNGLAGNWQLLDGAVGTVAEHSTQIAGKAPAVHTHTKSDVTDLLNSNFIPSANNSYDLGSSSYQWKSVYAQSYYYNGVACGDILTHNASEFVDVSSAQTIGGVKTFTSNMVIQGSKKVTCNLDNSFIELDGGTTWGKGGSIVLSGQDRSSYTNSVLIVSKSDTNTDILQYQNGELKPLSNNTNNSSLGTSTNKWKTLNGINPGALSLPSATAENIDTTNWDFSWSANTVTAPFDGYISIACFGSALQINDETKSYAMTFAPGTDGYICGLLPVSSGDSIKVLVIRTQTSIYEGYKFIKANGNVS